MPRSWTIGKNPGCDRVVNQPGVSEYHCRLTLTDDTFFLEDLGGAGTFVAGRSIQSRTRVTRADAILLAEGVPMPWPADALRPGSRVLTIGRLADNDIVIDLAVVSGRHARVIWDPSTQEAFIEDLGSSNGTFLASRGKVPTHAVLKVGDTVLLGTHSFPASEIFARFDTSPLPRHTIADRDLTFGRDPRCDAVIDLLAVSSRHALVKRVGGAIVIEDLGSSNGTFVNGEPIKQPSPVVSGDIVTLGNYSFVVVDSRNPATTTTQPIRVESVPVPPPPAPPPPVVIAPRPSKMPLVVGAICVSILAVAGSIAAVVWAGRSNTEQAALAKSDPNPGPVVVETHRPPSPNASSSFSTSHDPVPNPVPPPLPSVDAPAAPVPKPIVKRTPAPVPATALAPNEGLDPPASYHPSKETIAWANALDLSTISAEDEQRLGSELHAIIMGQEAKGKKPRRLGNLEASLKRVEEAAAPFLEARSRKALNYKFTILDSDAVNAFSIPGGFVYVCRGLFRLIGEDEPFALEFVIGHEIAHVDLKHTFVSIASGNADAKKKGIDSLQQCLVPVAFGYPDRLEFEADAWAWEQMTKHMDRSRYEALGFIRRFEGFATENGFPTDGHGIPEPGTNILDNHFRAHPSPRERRKRADKILGPSLTTPSRGAAAR